MKLKPQYQERLMPLLAADQQQIASFTAMPQRGSLFVEIIDIDFGFLPQRGNLITLQIIMQERGYSAGARIIFLFCYLQTLRRFNLRCGKSSIYNPNVQECEASKAELMTDARLIIS